MHLLKPITLFSLFATASLPLMAQSSLINTEIGKPTLLSQLLTLGIAVLFSGMLIAAIAKLFKENGVDKEDPHTKRIGCTGIFLIVLLGVVLVSVTATSYTGIRMEENSKHFMQWFIDILRRLF